MYCTSFLLAPDYLTISTTMTTTTLNDDDKQKKINPDAINNKLFPLELQAAPRSFNRDSKFTWKRRKCIPLVFLYLLLFRFVSLYSSSILLLAFAS